MIGIAGLSHLGIVTSVAAAAKGFDVVAYDPDEGCCDELRRGELPVVEPQLPELLAAHRERMAFTADPARLAECEVVLVASDVPTDAMDHSDLSVIRRLALAAAAHAAPGSTLVVNSQVPPGFTRELDRRLREERRGAAVHYQVETLVIGRAMERALAPERLIVGCREPAAELPASYAAYLSRFACPILRMRYESAELAKIAVNMYLASSVCTTNTLAELCEAIGADWREIIPALASDRRIGPDAYVRPGLGLSGGNLERDLASFLALARQHGADGGLVEAWLANSRRRRGWALEVLRRQGCLARPEAVIAVWGLAYKPGTASVKHAPSLDLLEALVGCAVRVYDPSVRLEFGATADQVASALEACEGADALVVMTPWPEFSSVDLVQVRERMRGRVIVDPFGALDAPACLELGFSYAALGAPAREASERPMAKAT